MKFFLQIALLVLVGNLSFSQQDTSRVPPKSCISVSWGYPAGFWDSIPENIIIDYRPFVDCQEDNCHLNVQMNCPITAYSIRFFNRWGEVLFESQNPDEKWYANEQPDSVYIYWIKGTYLNGEDFEHKGHVTLLH